MFIWPWQLSKFEARIMATLEDYKALVQAGFERIALEQQEVDSAVSELKAKIQELIDLPPAEPDYSAAILELQGLVDAIPTIYNAPTEPEPVDEAPPAEEEPVDEVPPVEEPTEELPE
jgi:hypothetical protein